MYASTTGEQEVPAESTDITHTHTWQPSPQKTYCNALRKCFHML